ncbi:MAG: hypothetical protein AAF502_08320 [Bacteroidota bacterium]
MTARYVFEAIGRKVLGRWVFGFIVVFLLYRFASNAFTHQLASPVLKFAWVDLAYWMVHLLRLPEMITGHLAVSIVFDLLLFTSAVLSAVFVNKRIFPIAFGVLFALYFLTYNSFSAHHTHCMAGILLVSIPFWFKSDKSFSFLWEGLRYFTLWIYFSAFLWKLFRGALFHLDQGYAVFLNETANYIVQAPDSFWGKTYSYFIANPDLATVFVAAGVIAQAAFIIGFFTRKLDWLWFILPILFHTISYCFLGVFFFELLVLNFTLLPPPLTPPSVGGR